MIKIGIDPGLSGAIAVLDSDNHYLELFDMPTYKAEINGKMRRNIDIIELERIFKNVMLEYGFRCLEVMVEQCHAGANSGMTGNFSAGKNYGILLSVLTCLKLEFAVIHPSTWKAKLGQRGLSKEEWRLLAIKRWPDAPLSRKKDHDRADALFLASML